MVGRRHRASVCRCESEDVDEASGEMWGDVGRYGEIWGGGPESPRQDRQTGLTAQWLAGKHDRW